MSETSRNETKTEDASSSILGAMDDPGIRATTPIDADATLEDFDPPERPRDAEALPSPSSGPKAPPRPPESLAERHRAMTLREALSDDREMAAFRDRLGIDPDDPQPGHEALILVREIFDAASRVRGSLAEEGDRLLESLREGTADRRTAAVNLSEAATGLDEASRACEEARLALDASVASAVESLEEGSRDIATRASKAVAVAAAKACESIPAAARSELERASGAIVSGFESSAEKMAGRLKLSMSAGAQSAGAIVSRIVEAEAPKVADAVTRGILAAEAKRGASDPWRWRKVAILGATLVVCMITAFVGGREMGRAHADPPSVSRAQ